MSQKLFVDFQAVKLPIQIEKDRSEVLPLDHEQAVASRSNGVSTVDFRLITQGSQVCSFCWGLLRNRHAAATGNAKRIVALISRLGVRRIRSGNFDPAKHLLHSRGWGKGKQVEQVG